MFTLNKHKTNKNKNQYQQTDHFSDVVYLQIRMTEDGFGRRMMDSDVKWDRYIRLLSSDFNGRVPGYWRRWAIIGTS